MDSNQLDVLVIYSIRSWTHLHYHDFPLRQVSGFSMEHPEHLSSLFESKGANPLRVSPEIIIEIKQ